MSIETKTNENKGVNLNIAVGLLSKLLFLEMNQHSSNSAALCLHILLIYSKYNFKHIWRIYENSIKEEGGWDKNKTIFDLHSHTYSIFIHSLIHKRYADVPIFLSF